MELKEILNWIHKAKLENWDGLDLSKNRIARLPPEIGELENLSVLDVSKTGLVEIPPEIGLLTNLRVLKVSGNKLISLPKEIGLLKTLMTLDVSDNSLTDLPSEIGNLSELLFLNASNNKLSSLPVKTTQLGKLIHLDLRENPLPIPPEILEKTDNPKATLNYYATIKETQSRIVGEKADYTPEQTQIAKRELIEFLGIRKLNESKMLVVGQGSVGKTSLVQQILHSTFDQNQTKTEGISINQWMVNSRPQTGENGSSSSVLGQSESIKLNIWDFGGQEIMHATHQFFLTKRSLYLLVLDARLTQEENRVEYWLKIIQSFGGESPVLIVGNKTDQHPLDIDRTGLQKKYPNIVGILETSAATGVGIAALKAEIAKQVDTLPHVRDLLPETWFMVKSKLEELAKNKNFFTQDEYLGLCDMNDVKDETSQHTLIGFLHDLGVVLHFQDDPRLEALGILNPQWVTNGVYKILNSHELFQNHGQLTLPLLNKILNLPEYPRDKRLFIVDMMKKFELCYDIELDKSFLIPDLLPKDEPFTGEWEGVLAFQIHYNILPSSIISRFIVRMNAFIHKTVWRSGVVLKSGGNTALVKADTEDRKIYIWVTGELATRKEFLAAIRMEFAAIHNTIAKIEAIEKVPLLNAPDAPPVDYEFLLRLEKEGRESLPVQAGNQIIDLIVKEVLSRIDTEVKRTEIHIHGNINDSNIIAGDKNKSDIKTKKSKKTGNQK